MTKARVPRPESSHTGGEANVIKHSQQHSRKHLTTKRRQKCTASYPTSEIHATIATPSADEAIYHAKTTSFIHDDLTEGEYLSLVPRQNNPCNSSSLDFIIREPIEEGVHQYNQSIEVAAAAAVAPTTRTSDTNMADLGHYRTQFMALPYDPHREFSEMNTLSVASNPLHLPSIFSQVTTGPRPSSHQHLDLLLSDIQISVERTMFAASFLPVTGARVAALPSPDALTCLSLHLLEQALVQPSLQQFPKYNYGNMNFLDLLSEPILALSSQAIPGKGLLLACPEDRGMLNDHLILLRRQIEFFQATAGDIMSHTRGRGKDIALRQVGVRCRHCSHIPAGQKRKGSTYFPSTLMGIYQAAQNINIEHLQSGVCPEMPEEAKIALITTRANKTAASVMGKAYWAESARGKGLIDTEGGINFAGDGARSLLLPTRNLPNSR